MQMKPTVRAFVSAGYPIREVDVTRETDLARQHNVSGIPCFVMLVDGQEVDRVVGATTGQRLEQMFKRAQDAERQNADRVRLQSAEAAPPAATTVGVESNPPRAIIGATQDTPQPLPMQAPEHEKLLAATVRLRVEESKGQAYATGTIIDSREGQALVITCGHLFRESEGKAPLTVEVFERGPGGIRAAGPVTAQLVHYDLERDLALVGIWPTHPVSVASVAPKGSTIERGDRAVSVGCSHGENPTALPTRITTLDRYNAPPNIEATGAPVQGRSGGGLFNDQGQLIGVCFAADYEGNEGLYASLESIHAELAQNGLSEIYERVAAGPSRETPVVRGQEPLETVVPLPDASPGPLTNSATVTLAADAQTAPANLNAIEQAAFEEIMKRAATAEVVCIIRPKEPGGQSEIITLDDVSPEFVRALAERQRKLPSTKR
jgi:S1-C subfamily serine protease